ncbi:MAG: sensor domain-containing diguanylate cyclase [Methylococcaceae bacterium]|nr:sensor domain-containing diguanylate cyclase [Methylococcaceae bacterium]
MKHWSDSPIFRPSFGWYITLTICLLGSAVSGYLAATVRQRDVDRQRTEVANRLATLRVRLEAELNSTLHLTRGLTSFVATHPDAGQEELAALATDIVTVGRHVRNIGLAPDNVLRMVFPATGNEAAIGLNYRQNSQQWPAVERAINLRSTVVAGPMNLVQGGIGLIARTPIFVARNGETNRYWGLASIVIDVPSLFGAAGLVESDGDIDFALRGVDGLGAGGAVITGRPETFADAAITRPLTIPNGEWLLAARPRHGWKAEPYSGLAVALGGNALTLTIAALSWLLLRSYRLTHTLALRDPLTGLANRRLLMERLSQLGYLAERGTVRIHLFFIDLDHFKDINDRYGHGVGDALLVEIAARLEAASRRSDTVARIGGDEFVVAAATDFRDHPTELLGKLRQVMSLPFHFDGHQLPVSCSIGHAVYPDDAERVEELLQLADQRMYYEKKARLERAESSG